MERETRSEVPQTLDRPRPIDGGSADRRTPAITHFAVLTAFILPLTLLPYLAMRRQISLLRRKVDEVGLAAASLKTDLRTAVLATAARKEEDLRIRSLVHEMKQDMEKLRIQSEQRQRIRMASDNLVRSDLRKLLDERPRAATQVAMLRDLGSSLADVAAFMEEIELQQGLTFRRKEGLGIERLRLLALKMESLPHHDEAERATTKRSSGDLES